MKLVLAIIHDEDAFQIMDLLSENGFSVTKLASTGGFLRAGNTTLISGTEDEKVPVLLDLLEKTCKSRKQITSIHSPQMSAGENYMPYPVEVTVGGATIFVMDVETFRKV